ncbi:hypothetical protein [Thalassobius sp. MITS945101]|uniref:hypothetical protein n=1 Tax=Thalassobius sp. MITS945101 TaxID=3096994 RepID=UPI0039996105
MACEYVEGTWLDTAILILAALLFFSPILLGFRLKRKDMQHGRQRYWWGHFLPTFSTVLVVYAVAIHTFVFLPSDTCLATNLGSEGFRIGQVIFLLSFSGIGLALHAFGYALAGQTSRETVARPEISKEGT